MSAEALERLREDTPTGSIRTAARHVRPLLSLEYRARCAGTRVWDTPTSLRYWADADGHYNPAVLMETEVREGNRVLGSTGLRLSVSGQRVLLTGAETSLLDPEHERRALVARDILDGMYARIAIQALTHARTAPYMDVISPPDLELAGTPTRIIPGRRH